MSKILNFGVGAAMAALTTSFGLASAYAYTPPALGSPQQNFGLVPTGPGLKIQDTVAVSGVTITSLLSTTGNAVYDIQATAGAQEFVHFYSGTTAAPTCSLTTVSALVVIPSGVSRTILNDQYGVGPFTGYCVTSAIADGDHTTLTAATHLDVYYH
jgi:hypothetical protein